MDSLLDAGASQKPYKDSFDKFPQEIQDAITTPAEQAHARSSGRCTTRPSRSSTHRDDEAGKKLKGDDKQALRRA